MRIFLSFIFFLFFANSFAIEKLENAHAISMHGKPKYGQDFINFDYVNIKAKKGSYTIKFKPHEWKIVSIY